MPVPVFDIGTVNAPKSMAMPQRSGVAGFRYGIKHRCDYPSEQFNRQPSPRCAVVFAVEGKSHQERNVIASGIAREGLREKGVHHGSWIKSSKREKGSSLVCVDRGGICDA